MHYMSREHMNQTDQTNSSNQGQTIIIQQGENSKNGIGVAGFVLALISLFLGWIPLLGWLGWFLGAVFSFIGIFKKPRGLAIVGLIISFIGLIILLTVVGTIATLGAFGG